MQSLKDLPNVRTLYAAQGGVRISELIACLERRLKTHGDREVLVTWESITREIEPTNVYLSKCDQLLSFLDTPVLLIDADGNYYKKDFAVDPREGADGQ